MLVPPGEPRVCEVLYPGTKNYYCGCFSLGCVIVQWSCGDCISDEERALDNGQCVAILLLSTITHILKGLGFCS